MVRKGGGAEGRGRGPWKVALMGLRDEQHGWGKACAHQAPGGRLPRRSGEGWELMSLTMSRREFHSPLGSGIKSWEGWSRGWPFFLISLVVM